jgi:rod shape-determining protein MreC
MGVITPEGVVGKVIESYRDTSQVLVLTDRDSGVGAMIANSRIQSPVGGTGEPLLNMKYVGNDDEVAVGSRVVTSGMDRIFPKDLPVGVITQVKPGGQYKQIRVKPSANLEKLEEVIVLLTTDPVVLKPEPAPQADNSPAKVASPTPSTATTAKPTDKRP